VTVTFVTPPTAPDFRSRVPYFTLMVSRVLLIGGAGLVGNLVADRLLADCYEVHALVRRATNRRAPAWHEHVAAPQAWPALARDTGGHVAISALGTTYRAAGSDQAFRAVDFDMVVDFATAARGAGVRQMILVSSVGADPRSRAFYLRVKGEVEDALAGLGFDRLDIVRPGLLLGARRPDRRLKERLAIAISPAVNLLLRGRLDKYAAVDAATVADAIVALAGARTPGQFIHHYRDLHRLANSSS
jgi:uncharacterized protein YbjT (DUF2867 family)